MENGTIVLLLKDLLPATRSVKPLGKTNIGVKIITSVIQLMAAGIIAVL
jgi:hypothetical protein